MMIDCKACGKKFEDGEIKNLKGQYIRNGVDYCSDICVKTAVKRWAKNGRENKHFGGNRQIVLERDGFKCVLCGNTEQLQVHHKDGNGRGSKEKNNEISNLTTLCCSCHVIIHNKRHHTLDNKMFIINNWNMSNREIGRRIKCTHPTVAILRKEIESSGDLKQ